MKLSRLSKKRADQVGFSRFLYNESVELDRLMKASTDHCRGLVGGKHVFIIQDTTEVNYQSHRSKLKDCDEDLGPVGNNTDIGYFLHPSLVVDASGEFPLGFSHIHIWNRSWDKQDKHERSYKQQPLREKESYRWIASSQKSQGCLAEANRLTIIADRESDIYEEFAFIPDDRTDLLIRSKSNRRLYDQGEKLFEYLNSQPVSGSFQLQVRADKRKQRKAREAVLEVRYCQVKIKRPDNVKQAAHIAEYVDLYAVEAREHPSTVPPGEKPILWRLLTTHAVNNYQDACQIIRWYSLRWLIEQLFRLLKRQGLDLEDSGIENGAALKKLAVFALQAALIILQLLKERDGKSDLDANVIFHEKEIQLLEKLNFRYEGKTDKQKNPHRRNSLAWAAWIIARVGGWKGYQSQGPPGPITMKQGIQDFYMMMTGWLLNYDDN